MRELTSAEISCVYGAGIVADGAACIGGGIAITGTDGIAAIGLGIATAGACFDFGQDLGALAADWSY